MCIQKNCHPRGVAVIIGIYLYVFLDNSAREKLARYLLRWLFFLRFA